VLGEFDGLGGAVSAGTGDNFAAAVDTVDNLCDHLVMLGHTQGRRFSGGADRHDTGDAAGNLRFHQVMEGRRTQFAVFKGRDQCGVTAFELHEIVSAQGNTVRLF